MQVCILALVLFLQRTVCGTEVDGHCGNSTRDRHDDNAASLVERKAHLVSPCLSLFARKAEPQEAPRLSLSQCPSEKRTKAITICTKMIPESVKNFEFIRKACALNSCFVSFEFATWYAEFAEKIDAFNKKKAAKRNKHRETRGLSEVFLELGTEVVPKVKATKKAKDKVLRTTTPKGKGKGKKPRRKTRSEMMKKLIKEKFIKKLKAHLRKKKKTPDRRMCSQEDVSYCGESIQTMPKIKRANECFRYCKASQSCHLWTYFGSKYLGKKQARGNCVLRKESARCKRSVLKGRLQRGAVSGYMPACKAGKWQEPSRSLLTKGKSRLKKGKGHFKKGKGYFKKGKGQFKKGKGHFKKGKGHFKKGKGHFEKKKKKARKGQGPKRSQLKKGKGQLKKGKGQLKKGKGQLKKGKGQLKKGKRQKRRRRRRARRPKTRKKAGKGQGPRRSQLLMIKSRRDSYSRKSRRNRSRRNRNTRREMQRKQKQRRKPRRKRKQKETMRRRPRSRRQRRKTRGLSGRGRRLRRPRRKGRRARNRRDRRRRRRHRKRRRLEEKEDASEEEGDTGRGGGGEVSRVN
eukprot:TRINITY_DN3013_c0_g1_i1.p1 TRINITY_DN3013_c0_g1~~TRINITY_DN3013_c0_g1_i1.p1  ORF type:complete len:573 (+),score=101.42 TRINITY_DN3013_c0_g1_i1:45-1763(+)